MVRKRVYLDYAATTPVDQQVVDAMTPYFNTIFGNPSSIHFYGQEAEHTLEQSRERVAVLLGGHPSEIIFTSCGTESDNLAIRGVGLARSEATGARRILTTAVEHHAVSHTIEQLVKYYGFSAEIIPVDSDGLVDPDDVKKRLGGDVALVSIIHANNEIGSINPVEQIGNICRGFGIPFHTDAVQAAAHLPMQRTAEWADLVSIGAHKFYGPKGAGALYKKSNISLYPAQTGGSQETGLRAGTENVPYIVGLATAFELTQIEILQRNKKSQILRDRIIDGVLANVTRSRLTGHRTQRLPNHASFSFEGVDGNQLLMNLDAAGFACSSGSACKVGDPKPSGVLLAIGLSPAWALGSLRVTLGKDSSAEEVDGFLDVLPEMVARTRSQG